MAEFLSLVLKELYAFVYLLVDLIVVCNELLFEALKILAFEAPVKMPFFHHLDKLNNAIGLEC